MADNVPITAGTGTTVGTKDVGSTHRQIVVLGDPSTAGGLAPVDATTGLKVNATALPLPSGASTSAKQDTAQTALDAIKTAVEIIDNGVSGSEFQVDVVAALPAGTNNIGDVDVLSVIPGTGATNLGKAEDAAHTTGDVGVAAMTVRQDTAAALAGTDADYQPLITDGSGRLHVAVGNTVTVGSHAVTNAGTFAVQVDGSALTALQLIDNIVLLEDAAHGSGDPGVQSLAVRKDAGAAIAGTDGDYSPLQVDSVGNLRVNIAAGGAAGGTSATDEAAYTPTSTAGTPIMGAADETAPDSAAEGTVGIVRMTLPRALHVNLRDAAGAEVSVGGGTQYDEDAAHSSGSKVTGAGIVRKDTAASLAGTDGDYTLPIADATGRLWTHDPLAEALLTTIDGDTGALAGCVGGTEVQVDVVGALPAGTNAIGKLAANSGVDIGDVDVASVIPGTGATNLGKAEDAAHTTGDVGVMALTVRQNTAAALSGADADYQPLITDTNGRLHVLEPSAASIATNTSNSATSLATMDDWDNAASDGASVSGDVAHDSADAGEPVKFGAKAKAALSGVTLVAADDRTDVFADLDGALITRPHCPLGDIVVGNASNTDGTSTEVIAAGGAGIKQYLTSVTLANTSATMIYVEIKSATTVRWRFPVPATGGVTHTFNPPLPPNAANEAWNMDASSATTTLYGSFMGFKSKV